MTFKLTSFPSPNYQGFKTQHPWSRWSFSTNSFPAPVVTTSCPYPLILSNQSFLVLPIKLIASFINHTFLWFWKVWWGTNKWRGKKKASKCEYIWWDNAYIFYRYIIVLYFVSYTEFKRDENLAIHCESLWQKKSYKYIFADMSFAIFALYWLIWKGANNDTENYEHLWQRHHIYIYTFMYLACILFPVEYVYYPFP